MDLLKDLSVTLIQSEIFWEDVPANLDMFERTLGALPPGREVVLLPEMFSTGFSMRPEAMAEGMNGQTVSWMKRLAKQRRIIIAGSAMIRENNLYYNRFLWVQPDGNISWYDKRHLFAYGHEDRHYSPGNRRVIVQVKGWKLCLQVCYDLRFPVWSRNRIMEDGLPEYDALIYIAAWPQRRAQAWKSLLLARAIENQCYVVGLNRTGKDGNDVIHQGDSMVVDPVGAVLLHCNEQVQTHEVVLSANTINETRAALPFLKDADNFKLLP